MRQAGILKDGGFVIRLCALNTVLLKKILT